MLGDDHFDALVATTPAAGSEEVSTVDWAGFAEAMREAGVAPSSALAVSWAHFSEHNVEALIEGTSLVVLHPGGIFASLGKRKMFGGKVKYRMIDFSLLRGFGADDYLDQGHGIFKFYIEFAGAGGMLLGRLEWYARGKRFKEKENRMRAMETASERDRFLGSVNALVGQ